ncbi:TetR/AcrR family transcriptional regulator [Burkholderia glumae]|uniref:TetR/AcrR family transcriptional regulator n=2 Tax=Burkholderia glumae TaxID=337 RepID=A0AAQ0BUY3_BURGL|nr:TetR/AcrR family transcriptional regulator [Burkholderia glumae]ACR32751.1 Transcriptional regulator, TetR family [Burkholderia glumae BGR1]MCM2485754.1 TetR/AcrR family transcriptional regulator [Burkholderia glumae]MCM2511592.1 TetR/AcrR family transcriptional regulator [Burkholderia glumae]MCM2541685.1 TetR/AcrR family transcriptional regulator [Burkholderia glumae]NVE26257.1 TetR/AcrR family transcriptional regulator [Burkholderia glumae]
MARPMEFDRSEALARAIDAFWECGYGALSANDLADRMRIGKSSLYNTFGSKAELLQEAVVGYTDLKSAALQQAMRGRSAVDVLRALLLDIVKRNDDGRGCLLVNTAVELGRHDAHVAQTTRAGFDAMAAAFEGLIASAQQAGEIRADLDAKDHARILVTSIAGLRVMVQSGFTSKEMRPFIETVLASMRI